MDIWVIDDNPLHLALIELICKEHNIDFRGFSTSKELVRALEKDFVSHIPKVVFIDLVLEEGKRGEEVLQILKEKFKGKGVKYIAFTADVVRKKDLINLGFDDVIFKPLLKEKLEKAIKEILYKS